jgi:hypothetical protein
MRTLTAASASLWVGFAILFASGDLVEALANRHVDGKTIRRARATGRNAPPTSEPSRTMWK